MGGKATWMAVYEAPDRFAAVAPISSVDYQPEWIAHRCRWNRVAAWIICGGNDGEFTDGSRRMHSALQLAEAQSELTVVPNEGHEVWGRYYPKPEFYAWLLKHSRNQPAAAIASTPAAIAPGSLPAASGSSGSPSDSAPPSPLPVSAAASVYARVFIGLGALLFVVALLLISMPETRERSQSRTER
jgi:hypothetical protein